MKRKADRTMARDRADGHEPHEELEHLDTFDENEQQAEFWEQQPGETNYSFKAFRVLLRIGQSRRLREGALRFYYGDGRGRYHAETTLKPTQLHQFKTWSRLNMWQARAEAFDVEEHAKWVQELDDHRRNTIDAHLKMSRNGLAVVNNRFREYLEGTERVPNSAIASLLSTITNLQRLTVGEATSRSEDKGKPVKQPDYSQLTDKEVAFLDDIGEKLYGNG
jgi:hypothetical protein